MFEPATFRILMGRVQAGDEEAANELVRLYEPQVRRIARVRLNSPTLRRELESTDVCQSVMFTAVRGLAKGKLQCDSPEKLLSLLAVMAQNEVRKAVREQHAQKRDCTRVVDADVREVDPALQSDTPSVKVERAEFLKVVLDRLSPDEQFIAHERARNVSWEELGERLGLTADALRVRFSRKVSRIKHELGLDEHSP